jgi:gamma-glutamyltranspeptidase/glutathione hydrolase
MMISLIQSNYMGFGSGIVVPGTGVSLQNRGHCFTLDPAAPQRGGGGKRPFHTIIPGFLTEDGRPQMSFGVMGGNMQPQGHLQTLVRMLTTARTRRPPATRRAGRSAPGCRSTAKRRWHPALVQGLRDRGHQVEAYQDSYMDFGSRPVHLALTDDLEDGYVAASDSRRDGHAACF